MNRRHIYLIGFMGTGKSSAGRCAAQMSGIRFDDLDDLITERIGMTITGYMNQHGEDAFRDVESSCLSSYVADHQDTDFILSCGGGVILRDGNRSVLRGDPDGLVIRLTAEEETVCERVMLTPGTRPVLNTDEDGSGGGGRTEQEKALRDRVHRLMGEREERYRITADVSIATDGKTPDEAAWMILRAAGLQTV